MKALPGKLGKKRQKKGGTNTVLELFLFNKLKRKQQQNNMGMEMRALTEASSSVTTIIKGNFSALFLFLLFILTLIIL